MAANDTRERTSSTVCIGISNLSEAVESLPGEQKQLFNRIFRINTAEGHVDPPTEKLPWIEKQFGPLSNVLEQKVVKIMNVVTFEGALYNRLRATRPIQVDENLASQDSTIQDIQEDPFSNPCRMTPRDPFGRIKGKYCITSSNIAKYDGLHGIVVFDNPDPLTFRRRHIHDYLETGWRWAQEAHRYKPDAKYFIFIWNCLRRAGASMSHGHAQVSLGMDCHYARIEGLRRAALSYREKHGSNYFDDLFYIHGLLGLGEERGSVRLLAYLTPVKEREVFILSTSYSDSFKDAVYDVLRCFRDSLNVTSFNLMITMPPLAKAEESWEGFPVIARVVDRGHLRNTSSDIGSMELYASSVIGSNPFEVARSLKECFPEEEAFHV